MSKKKKSQLSIKRRSFLTGAVKAGVVGATAASFPHIWMKQGNVYAANNEIRVGVLFSLTGGLAIIEESLHKATIMAIEEINAAGGVNGMKLKAIEADPASDPATFAAKARTLVLKEKCVTVFGSYTSACLLYTSPSPRD